ncbi:MAG: sn-glycerol-3-phosphate ABC transporter ATP-binding protein UgpC [Alphaproteobacteria bacterium]|nr:sn-glycerol-3-phosphate ABC transporter ATP-binding protein UgpC [Alphaproteobacteria bacterium]
MGTIDIQEVKKSYNNHPVIHGLTVGIQESEFIVIVGPSGCGKSTLLRMVAGLESITSGNISIGNKIVNKLEPKERNIAMVFQNYALYPHMTVFNNMAYGLKIAGTPKKEIINRVNQAADLLGINTLLNRKPRELSGGQRQRVAMGRAIVRQPTAFLFDEPLSNLDAKLRVQMRIEIKELQRRLKTTTLYVTHDQIEAMTLADRLIVMNNGLAEQIDTPLNIYQKPSTIFVADFIGSPSMNLLPSITNQTGNQLICYGNTIPLLKPVNANQEIILGIRPEHLRIVRENSGFFNLTINLIETLGSDTLIYGNLDHHTRLVARVPANQNLTLGQKIGLDTSLDHFHLFDKKTQKRI